MNIKDICCGTTPLEQKSIQSILDHIEKIVSLGGEIHFKKGQVIFYEGHRPLGFFVLKSGKIGLSRVMFDNEKEDLTNESKEIFGLFHLLTNTPHCAMATALTDVKATFVPKSVVMAFLKGL